MRRAWRTSGASTAAQALTKVCANLGFPARMLALEVRIHCSSKILREKGSAWSSVPRRPLAAGSLQASATKVLVRATTEINTQNFGSRRAVKNLLIYSTIELDAMLRECELTFASECGI